MRTKPNLKWVGLALTAMFVVAVFATIGDAQERKRVVAVAKQQQKLNVYNVAASRANAQKARSLGQKLGLKPEIASRSDLVQRGGKVSFTDQQLSDQIPMKQLGTARAQDEDKMAVTLEAMDINAIQQMGEPDTAALQTRVNSALTQSQLGVAGANYTFEHSVLRLYNAEGQMTVEKKLNTRVKLQRSLDGIPLVGPGSKVNVTFDRNNKVTKLNYSDRQLNKGASVSVLSQTKANNRFLAMAKKGKYGQYLQDLRVSSKLVYYAPPLEKDSAGLIMPFYDVGGTAKLGGQNVTLMREMIPALEGSQYVPTVTLEASAKGTTITAQVKISGGKPPYTIEWSSSNAIITSNKTKITYTVQGRGAVTSETLTVAVTDANGVTVKESKTIALIQRIVRPVRKVKPSGSVGEICMAYGGATMVAGVRDFGTENSVTNEFGSLESGFISEMQGDGVTKRFSWGGTSAWEQDFKPPNDSNYVDNVDICFYVGHGYPGGFTFEDTTHTDSVLDYDDATGAWGDKDLEWLALYSCTVLQDNWSGMSVFQRWKQEFDGLHLLLGFHTVAYVNSNFSKKFAHYMVRKPFMWWNKPMKVREAWFRAVDETQPSSVWAVVMGPRRSDGVTNYNDYFHGKGAVGPDIRGSSISGFWAVYHRAD